MNTYVARKRRRNAWAIIFLAGGYLILVGRLVYINAVLAEDFREKGRQDRQRTKIIPAERGRILDRNGKVLAFTLNEYRIHLHPKLIARPDEAARILSETVGVNSEVALKAIETGENCKPFITKVQPEQIVALRGALIKSKFRDKLHGVEIVQISRRVYPMGTLAAKLVGRVNAEGKPDAGVEFYANERLKGKDGVIYADFDLIGRPIPSHTEKLIPPQPGSDVILTIDTRIQYLAEQAISAQVKKYGARSGSCVVLDPATGDILALAEYPTYNPLKVTKESARWMKPYSVEGIYEPGSTFKLVTASAALKEGLGGVTSICVGRYSAGDHSVNCPCKVRHREPGKPVTIGRMLKYSCNTESYALARRMGSKRLYQEVADLGLLERFKIEGLGVTGGGMAPDPEKKAWPAIQLANISFGQGVATTRLNLASVYSAAANGGKLMNPRLVREYVSESEGLSRKVDPKMLRAVMSAEVSRKLLNMLEDVVLEGTGKTAQIDGYAVGGKTGSAQMLAAKGGYEAGAYCTSFCGIAPIDRPKVTILVTVENPIGESHGSAVAAPVFREVAHKALWYLGANPSTGKQVTGASKPAGFGSGRKSGGALI